MSTAGATGAAVAIEKKTRSIKFEVIPEPKKGWTPAQAIIIRTFQRLFWKNSRMPSVEEVGLFLGIATQSVKNHLSKIFKKTGFPRHSRSGEILFLDADSRGLITPCLWSDMKLNREVREFLGIVPM